MFFILVYFKIVFISVMAKLNFHQYFGLQFQQLLLYDDLLLNKQLSIVLYYYWENVIIIFFRVLR